MLPGLRVVSDREKGEGREDGGKEEEEEEEEEEEVVPAIPTPRKRLMNFKIPIINRSDQRRGQSASLVTRRRLFSDEGKQVQNQSIRSRQVKLETDIRNTHTAALELPQILCRHTATHVCLCENYLSFYNLS